MTDKEMMLEFEKYFLQLSKEQKEYILNVLRGAFCAQMGLYTVIEEDNQEKLSDDMEASMHT